MLTRPSLGLLGRIVAIILLTVTIEFAASTLLYERAGEFSIKEDEARRLAEHLVIVQRLVGERPPTERPAIARYLSTDRYTVHWQRTAPEPRALAAELRNMRDQVVEWEPSLANAGLQLQLASPGRHDIVMGEIVLADGTWIHFKMHGLVTGWGLQLNRIVLALVPAIALAVVGGLLVRLTLRPLKTLSQAIESMGKGERVIVHEEGPNEVRNLIRAFNRMQDQISRMIADRTQALAAVGHDLRTPLARLQLRLDGSSDAELRQTSERDIGEMEEMISSVLAYLSGDSDPEAAARVDLAVLITTLVDDMADHGHHVSYHGPDHLEAQVRPHGFRRAINNLIENAIHYGDDVRVTLSDWPGRIVLRVEDNGPGIPTHAMADVLQPFARLDSARSRNTKGLGLGLAIVSQMVEREGGGFTLVNRQEGGLRAEIVLPKTTPDQQ
ncbi:Signal transduction histidine kinase [Sphingomonas laterariae]|uniref:histidine kinase n=1 Tax=Edaphosphingomonas laterariae TaxID=861865 RepID=A0A239CUU6_9SPHN|nr:ATP-binding protein [Sphingomonas laterariae]SNS23985.1 Signal transduction histidine kinase [Sphingomonas laterariae]